MVERIQEDYVAFFIEHGPVSPLKRWRQRHRTRPAVLDLRKKQLEDEKTPSDDWTWKATQRQEHQRYAAQCFCQVENEGQLVEVQWSELRGQEMVWNASHRDAWSGTQIPLRQQSSWTRSVKTAQCLHSGEESHESEGTHAHELPEVWPSARSEGGTTKRKNTKQMLAEAESTNPGRDTACDVSSFHPSGVMKRCLQWMKSVAVEPCRWSSSAKPTAEARDEPDEDDSKQH